MPERPEWRDTLTRMWKDQELRCLARVRWYRPFSRQKWLGHAEWYARERLDVDRRAFFERATHV